MVWNINLYGQRGPSGYEFVQEVVARLKHFHITEVNWRGTWTADPEAQPFLRHDAVIHGPAVYIAQVDETTEEPGTGDDWELWIDWSQISADLATAQQVLLDTIENRTQAQEAQTESENLLENIETLHNVFSQTYLGALEEHPDPQEFTWGLGSFYYNTTIGQIYIWNGLTHEDPEGEWTDPVVPEAAVTAFNTRTGSIIPEEEDYSDFFYTKAQIDNLAQSLGNDLSSHVSDENNPHSVTKAQVGLGDVDNVSAAALRDRSTHTGTQALSTISDAGDAAGLSIGTTAGTVAAGDHSHDHFSTTDNPHEVTKAQVGLGDVTNDAQLKRAAGDYTTFGEKAELHEDDLILIEDSEDNGAKKRAKASNMLGGGGGVDPGFINWYGDDDPPDGWLVCDGAAVSRTTYADLFAVISTTFGAGNGSTTFNVPNLTGSNRFIRAAGGSLNVGSTQLDQMQRITGEIARLGATHAPLRSNANVSGVFSIGSSTSNSYQGSTTNGNHLDFDSADSPNARVSSTTSGETRPVNIALLPCIKY